MTTFEEPIGTSSRPGVDDIDDIDGRELIPPVESHLPTETEQPGSTTARERGGSPEPQFRTIAVRVDEQLHAQLSFIAQLAGNSISDEVRAAIERRIVSAQDDPALITRAQQVRQQIQREATARSAAIAGFMGQKAVTGVVDNIDSAGGTSAAPAPQVSESASRSMGRSAGRPRSRRSQTKDETQ